MTMPVLRRLVLAAHITASVGWFGAAAGFLVLSIAGMTSHDTQLVHAVYLAAEPITWYALVPLSLAALLTGITQSLITPWGLIQHYWVLFKLLLTVVATVVLLQYTRTVSHVAVVAAETGGGDVDELHGYVLHSAVGLLVLLVTTVLSVYKPRGLTPSGLNRQKAQRRAQDRQHSG
jgi:hypothetical protein